MYADPTATRCTCEWPTRRTPWAGRRRATRYLRIDKIIEVAEQSGADAVHPGYGFLSENADFAQAVLDAGLTWIGPPRRPSATSATRSPARHIALAVRRAAGARHRRAGRRARTRSLAFAAEYGLPVAIKAAFGGGGRGLKVARTLEEIPELFDVARPRGGRRVRARRVLRRAVPGQAAARRGAGARRQPRQRRRRRHPRLLAAAAPPEAGRGGAGPVPDRQQRSQLHDVGQGDLREAGYIGAGTVEFLVGQDGTICFLEVNTRLQVEHPVSEETAGIDLVREQFRIADGEPLAYRRPDAARARLRVPDQRRGPGPRLPARPRHRHHLHRARRARVSASTPASRPGRIDRRRVRLAARQAHRLGRRPATQALERSRRALDEYRRRGHGDGAAVPPRRRRATRPSRPPTASPFTVHTRWIETEFDNTIPAFTEPAEADARPPPTARPSSSRSAASASRSSLPAGFGGRRRRPGAARAAAPRRSAGRGRPSAAASRRRADRPDAGHHRQGRGRRRRPGRGRATSSSSSRR